MLESLGSVIMTICLTNLNWNTADLERISTALAFYDRQLEDFEITSERYEKNVYAAAQRQSLILRHECEQLRQNPNHSPDNIIFLTRREKMENDYYAHVHEQTKVMLGDAFVFRKCLKELVVKLAEIKEELDKTDEELPIPDDILQWDIDDS